MTQMMMSRDTFTMIGRRKLVWAVLNHEFKASVGTKFDHDIIVRLERLAKRGVEVRFGL